MVDVNISEQPGVNEKSGGLEQKKIPNRFEKVHRFIFRGFILSIILALVVVSGLIVLSSIPLSSLQQINQSIVQISNWLSLVRLLFIAILGLYWVEINTWVGARKQWSSTHMRKVHNGRWLAVGGLLFIELIFIQRIHQPLVEWIFAS